MITSALLAGRFGPADGKVAFAVVVALVLACALVGEIMGRQAARHGSRPTRDEDSDTA